MALDDVSNVSRAMILYDIIVLVLISFSITLSFMILLNLCNILVVHRMKEL